ncbi:pimeloyl-ACP methyl ester carboxylesterase [Crossiella equi]|uniref:Pimeloyl-ACP methyl ester carboxylesterase n=1 Tax=Crossiella equi TaxID=130796 RepID=A0ABS5A6I4_9PSEU|nr:alpha/beta hydrolase [Crossiella equi]MBP2472166.1 pimeloyl-ACP methyl ester carboxylesterase [Crossiella equi]
MERVFGAALVAVLVAGLLAPVGYAAPAISWSKCAQEPLRSANADCGFLAVPLDWDEPGGERIRLAVSRIAHTAAESKGPILVNPGGPGGSGVPWAALGSRVPNGVGEQYDWIGFDPRGVGASEPALSCDPDYMHYHRPAYAPVRDGDAVVTANLVRAKGYAQACGRSAGSRLLGHLTTEDTARDLDAIRQALGASRISYYGFSYGTYLGQVYATLFGNRLRHLVLDGVVDARDVWYRHALKQDSGFEEVIRIFFGWVAEHHGTYGLGSSEAAVRARFHADREALQARPALGLVGGTEFTDLLLPAAYSPRTWDGIARAWAEFVHRGAAEGLRELFDRANGPGDDNNYAISLATQCTDAPWPTSWHRWFEDHQRIAERAPYYTWANAWSVAPCRFWPVPPREPVRIDLTDAPPTLLLGETLDAATRYPSALRAKEIFPAARLVRTEGGTAHSDSLKGGLSCVDNAVADYLSTGRLPERDVSCAPPPRPKPVR